MATMPKFPPGVLVKMLQSTNPDVARGAAHDLIMSGATAVPVLLKLLQEGSASVRGYAIQILGEIGPAAKDAVPALEAALQDASLRPAAETALQKIRGQAAASSGT